MRKFVEKNRISNQLSANCEKQAINLIGPDEKRKHHEHCKIQPLLFLATIDSAGVAEAAGYKNLSLIVSDIQASASGSGGEATGFTLKNSSGGEIQTGGITLRKRGP